MKRKQLLSAALAMVLGISTLAGCSDKKETNNDAPADNKANEESKADGDRHQLYLPQTGRNIHGGGSYFCPSRWGDRIQRSCRRI